ncbi:hypothetical protein GN958_ATG22673 [Phytophthora infestans]|uniref:Uncharacterized protein n=1 Tax=Phytophthora infestans TaxID=4787 RepID=A0A8S9TMR1_PHYIN|nr:hypothetical protein GN958_ATG22673 [Phytophthora infestans]
MAHPSTSTSSNNASPVLGSPRHLPQPTSTASSARHQSSGAASTSESAPAAPSAPTLGSSAEAASDVVAPLSSSANTPTTTGWPDSAEPPAAESTRSSGSAPPPDSSLSLGRPMLSVRVANEALNDVIVIDEPKPSSSAAALSPGRSSARIRAKEVAKRIKAKSRKAKRVDPVSEADLADARKKKRKAVAKPRTDATIPAPLSCAFPPACGDDQPGLQAAYAKQVSTVSATSAAFPSRGHEEPLAGTSSSAPVDSAFNLENFMRGFQPGGPTVPVSSAPPPNNPRSPST